MSGQITQKTKDLCKRLAVQAQIKLAEGDLHAAEATASEAKRLLDLEYANMGANEAHILRQRIHCTIRHARHPNPSWFWRLGWRLSDSAAALAVTQVDSRRRA